MSDFDKIDNDLDSIEQSNTSGETPKINAREAVTAGAEDAVKSFASNFKETSVREQITDISSGFIPEVIGPRRFDAIKDALEGVSEDVSNELDTLKRGTKGFVSAVDSVVPKDGVARKALNYIKDKLGLTDDSSAVRNTAPSIDTKVEELLDRTFGAPTNANADAASLLAASNQIEATKQLGSILHSAILYNGSISSKYYRKSLELKYRHLIVAKETKSLLNEALVKISNNLLGIKQNTALPDIIKIRSTEALKANIRSNLTTDLYKRMTQNNTWTTALRENLAKKVRVYTGGISTALDLGTDFASNVADMKEMSSDMEDMFDPEMMTELGIENGYTPKSMAGKIAAQQGSTARKFVGAILGKLLRKSKHVREVYAKINDVLTSPSTFFHKQAEATTDDTLLNKMKRGLFGTIADLTAVGGESYGNITMSKEDLNDATTFDGRAKHAVTDVIPTILSKIYGAVEAIRTGRSPVDLQYDYASRKFVNRTKFKDQFKKELTKAYKQTTIPVASEGMANDLIMSSKTMLSVNEKDQFKTVLTKAILSNPTATYTELSDMGLFDDLDDKTKLKFQTILDNAVIDTSTGEKDFSKIEHYEDVINNIASERLDMSKRIEAYTADGFGPELVKLGVVTYDENTDSYRINSEVYRQYTDEVLQDILIPEVKVTLTKEEQERIENAKAILRTKERIRTGAKTLYEGIRERYRQAGEKTRNMTEESIHAATEKFDKVSDTLEEVFIHSDKKITDKQLKSSLFGRIIGLLKPEESKIKYDTDGDGLRDGSWQSILRKRKKASKEEKPMDKGRYNVSKQSSGILGGLMGALPSILATSVGALFSVGGAAFTGLSSLLTPLFGGVVGAIGLTGHILGGIFKLTRLLNVGIRTLVSAVATRGLGGIGGFTGKKGILRKIGGFIGKHKFKLGAVGLAAYGLDKLFDTMIDHTGADDAFYATENMSTTTVEPEEDGYGVGDAALDAGLLSAPMLLSKFKKKENTEVSKKAKDIKSATGKQKSLIGKIMSKGKLGKLGKIGLKRVPFLGTVLNLGSAAMNLAKGDFKSAGLDVINSVVSSIPILALGSMAYDLASDDEDAQQEKSDNSPSDSPIPRKQSFAAIAKTRTNRHTGADDAFYATENMSTTTVEPEEDGYGVGDAALDAGLLSAPMLLSKFKKKENTEVSKKAKDIKSATGKQKSLIGKIMSKGKLGKLGKIGLKRVPFLGTVLNLGSAAMNLAKGDFKSAGLDVINSVVSSIPILALGSMAYDLASDDEDAQQEKSDNSPSDSPIPRKQSFAAIAKTRTNRHTGAVTGRIEAASVHNPRFRRRKASTARLPGLDKADRLILELIAKGESKTGPAGYNVTYGNGRYDPPHRPPLTEMTLSEIYTLQDYLVKKSGKSGAVGKYQFIPKTLHEVVNAMRLPDSTLFDTRTQDALALYRLTSFRKYKSWKRGDISNQDFAHELSKEYASFPDPRNGGKSHYHGRNGNVARLSLSDVYTALTAAHKLLGIVDQEPTMATDQAQASNAWESPLVSGLRMAIKAALSFFGVTTPTAMTKMTKEMIAGKDSPEDTGDSSRKQSPQKRKVPAVASSPDKLCGIPFIHEQIPELYQKHGRKKIVPQNLVIHNTASKKISWSWVKESGNAGHIYIDRDGTVYLVNEIDDYMWHIGKHPKNPNVGNNNSIGIEMVSAYNKQKGAWDPYTEAQKKALLKVSSCILSTYGLDQSNVYYHEEVSYKTALEGKEGTDLIKGYASLDTDAIDAELAKGEKRSIPMPNTSIAMQSSLPSGDAFDSKDDAPIATRQSTTTRRSVKLNTSMQSDGPTEVMKNITAGYKALVNIDNTLTAMLSMQQEFFDFYRHNREMAAKAKAKAPTERYSQGTVVSTDAKKPKY